MEIIKDFKTFNLIVLVVHGMFFLKTYFTKVSIHFNYNFIMYNMDKV